MPRPPVAGATANGQGVGEGLGIFKPVGRVLGQAAQNDPLEVGGDVGSGPRWRCHALLRPCAIIAPKPLCASNGGLAVSK